MYRGVKKIRHTDYSAEMPHLDFEYDEDYYPNDDELPDPQVEPVIPGSRVCLDKVRVLGQSKCKRSESIAISDCDA